MTRFKGIIAAAFASAAFAVSPAAAEGPEFKVDASWPKRLPNNWILGQIGGMTVDAQDHIWVFQRPRSLEPVDLAERKSAKCCFAAPSVIEFDAEGNVVSSWGAPGYHPDWPESEHGIMVDGKNQVWLTGNSNKDGSILKFSRDGKFLAKFGKQGPITNSQDRTQLGSTASIALDQGANELFLADGYGNRRVVVLDSETLAFKRMWGAYGKAPMDPTPRPANYNPNAEQFTNPVHCVKIANDGLVYVCDRTNLRIQVFRKDGTYVNQIVVRPTTRGTGSAYDLAFWPDRNQTYLIVADGADGEAVILRRDNGQEVGFFGHYGKQAGEFHNIHQIVADSKGNMYTGEVDSGMRIQKFVPNMAPAK
jgi:NHL repeat